MTRGPGTRPARLPIIKRYYPGDPEDIPQTGNAPVLMRFDDFAKAGPGAAAAGSLTVRSRCTGVPAHTRRIRHPGLAMSRQ